MRTIKYTEPAEYLPKEIREKYFGKPKAKKTGTAKKTTSTKKSAPKKTK